MAPPNPATSRPDPGAAGQRLWPAGHRPLVPGEAGPGGPSRRCASSDRSGERGHASFTHSFCRYWGRGVLGVGHGGEGHPLPHAFGCSAPGAPSRRLEDPALPAGEPGRGRPGIGCRGAGLPRVPAGLRGGRARRGEGAKAVVETCLVRERSWSSSDFRPSAKLIRRNGVLEEQKSLGAKKRDTEVYVGNLPLGISEEELPYLSSNPLHVHKIQNGCKCFAFADLGSVQKVALAMQELNRKLFCKGKLYVNSNRRSPERTPDLAKVPWQLPTLEKFSGEGFAKTPACTQLIPKASVDSCETERPKIIFFAVPMEMEGMGMSLVLRMTLMLRPAQHPPGQGSFLVLLLKECFHHLSWLPGVHSIHWDMGLLVTSVIPQTPFFRAMHITENLHQNLELLLFRALAEAEEHQPDLDGSTVQRGTHCLAAPPGDYRRAWNRCWVLNRMDNWAVLVSFIDLGRSATIPVQSPHSLDSDHFWAITPLTQTSMLQKDISSSYQVIHRILKRNITGAVKLEVTAPTSNWAFLLLPPLEYQQAHCLGLLHIMEFEELK
ncbi:LOW QUALITY PROTEIN: tudor domain-containing protein 10 [Choloepus didactylus]|uniref:LOW QUALITY PROTEIN: tudor domain-containing protein 10 n=1 Tax=Choloepus didactylus TaxID=27675 RepID=UPI0018A11CB0|nr:LOW QUALITY PROTEIN: tudor domain-containing protein 10 [Choloepus didactylus]